MNVDLVDLSPSALKKRLLQTEDPLEFRETANLLDRLGYLWGEKTLLTRVPPKKRVGVSNRILLLIRKQTSEDYDIRKKYHALLKKYSQVFCDPIFVETLKKYPEESLSMILWAMSRAEQLKNRGDVSKKPNRKMGAIKQKKRKKSI